MPKKTSSKKGMMMKKMKHDKMYDMGMSAPEFPKKRLGTKRKVSKLRKSK